MFMRVLQKNLPKFEEISYPHGKLYWLGKASLSQQELVSYLEKGKFPNQIRGNFAFVWLGKEDWVAAVDHLASIPLFFHQSAISNLYSDLLETLEKKEKNLAVLYQMKFLGGHSLYGEETTHKGIRRILPGHFVKNGNSVPYLDYWSYLGDEPSDPKKFTELVESILLESVTNEKNTLLLSGGTDSTAIAGITKKLHLEKKFSYLHVYSSLQVFSEKSNVEKISQEMRLSTIFQEVLFSGDIDPEISRRQFSFWVENPFPGKRKAVELAGLQQANIFTGEIGDQLFGGPKNPPLMSYALQSKNISSTEVAAIWLNLSDSYGQNCGLVPSKRIQVMFEMDVQAKVVYEELIGCLAHYFDSMRSKDYLHRIMMLNYLVKGPYRMWAYSQDTLQWKHPFADWRLFDFCFRSPSNEKVNAGGVQKWILWNQWKDYLSDIPWRSKKHGFGIPAKDKFHFVSRDGKPQPIHPFAEQRSSEKFL